MVKMYRINKIKAKTIAAYSNKNVEINHGKLNNIKLAVDSVRSDQNEILISQLLSIIKTTNKNRILF